MNIERSATIIALLGVVLTAASVIASFAQYHAADLQAKAAVVALMPQIEVRALLEKVNSDKFTDRRIEVASAGGPIFNFNMERLSWIEFREGGNVKYEQPIYGYYFSEFPTGHTHGLISTIKGYRNNEDFIAFLEWAQPAMGFGVQISEPVTLLKMTFLDSFKQQNVLFVLVSGGSEIYLSEDAGKQLWERHSSQEKALIPVDLSKLKSKPETIALLQSWKSKLVEGNK